MSAMIMFSLCMSVAAVLPLMAQPLSLGFCIMLYSVLSCTCIGLMGSSWYGYILFLVYVGGLLVMFAYVSALAPNNFFTGLGSLIGVLFFSVLGLSYGVSCYVIDQVAVVMGVGDIGKMKVLSDCGYGIVLPSGVSVMVFLGLVLLVNLLAVVKVCYYQRGPLRPHLS
uniref:NADH-ubiquinone oxidoreductase chain 6 n=1 Tax=Granata lyrata TaxID=479586 RepID=A0A0S1F5M3_GRALY|nr:NADH dehydrogenase subunit 6 [Granata lyrata]ALK03371.1 NADH dehydrogenase subunit 6 [Granata lyrata]